MRRSSLLAIALLWGVIVVSLLGLPLLPAYAQGSVSVEDIVRDPDRYDGRMVVVVGNINSYRERVSRRGNPYTTFRLEDGGFSVAVFVWGHQGLSNGKRVRVTGMFQKVKRVGQYTFYNEISADQVELLR